MRQRDPRAAALAREPTSAALTHLAPDDADVYTALVTERHGERVRL